MLWTSIPLLSFMFLLSRFSYTTVQTIPWKQCSLSLGSRSTGIPLMSSKEIGNNTSWLARLLGYSLSPWSQWIHGRPPKETARSWWTALRGPPGNMMKNIFRKIALWRPEGLYVPARHVRKVRKCNVKSNVSHDLRENK